MHATNEGGPPNDHRQAIQESQLSDDKFGNKYGDPGWNWYVKTQGEEDPRWNWYVKKEQDNRNVLHTWLKNLDLSEEEIKYILLQFQKPEYGITDLSIVYLLDDEEIDEVLENLPLGKRKLIKEAADKESVQYLRAVGLTKGPWTKGPVSAGRASHGAASSEAPDMPLWDQYTDWYPLQGPGLRHLIAEHGRPVPPGSSVAYRTVVEREAAALEAGVVEEADADEADAREVDREIETKYGYKTGSRKEMKRVNALLLDRMRIELTSKRAMQRKSIEKPECCICIRREATVALNPCGHVCLCEYCARGPNQLETCPICRTRCNVLPPLRIYMATPLPVSDSNIIPFL